MGMRSAVSLLVLSAATAIPCQGASDAVLEHTAWPERQSCNVCIPLQFGILQLRLPVAQIGNILVLGSSAGGVNLFPASGEFSKSVLLGSIERDELMGLFETSGLLRTDQNMSAEAFFDRLGQRVPAGDPFATLRKINGLDRAQRYLKASRDGVHAYSIQSNPPNAEAVYFVVDNQSTVYSLSGTVTPATYDMILSNLRVAPIP